MNPEVASSIEFLKTFDCSRGPEAIADRDATPLSSETKAKIIEALKRVGAQSDYQMFGVLADSYAQALAAVQDFAQAFDLELPEPPESMDGAIYLKYNPATRLCYCDTYKGEHRGVLVSMQSDFEDGINEMFGHFPLDLYR